MASVAKTLVAAVTEYVVPSMILYCPDVVNVANPGRQSSIISMMITQRPKAKVVEWGLIRLERGCGNHTHRFLLWRKIWEELSWELSLHKHESIAKSNLKSKWMSFFYGWGWLSYHKPICNNVTKYYQNDIQYIGGDIWVSLKEVIYSCFCWLLNQHNKIVPLQQDLRKYYDE